MLVLTFILATAAPQQCGLCHPEMRVEHRSSIHALEQVGCTDCHGGNPEAIQVELAHRGAFRGRITRKQIPALCARCHSDAERMRPYNLPTDQYALYQISGHGRKLARGDQRVAVCTDCHGTHGVLSPSDPSSSAHHRNIPATCGKCHGDPALMARYGLQSDVYEEYLGSRHAEELLQKGNRAAPECSRCHGVHGAAPPGFGDVEKVCGGCHTSARRAFLDGPHAEAMAQAGLPECVSCHGSHGVQSAPRGRIAEYCRACHEQGSPQFALAEKMEALVHRAEEELAQARELIEEAERIPLYVEDHEARLQEAHTLLIEAEPAVHSVRLEDFERFTRAARSLGEEIQSEIQGQLADLRLRRVGLLVFWFYLLVTLAILYRYRQRALKERP